MPVRRRFSARYHWRSGTAKGNGSLPLLRGPTESRTHAELLAQASAELFGAGNSGRTTKATVQAARTAQSAAVSQEQFQAQMLEQMVFQSQALSNHPRPVDRAAIVDSGGAGRVLGVLNSPVGRHVTGKSSLEMPTALGPLRLDFLKFPVGAA